MATDSEKRTGRATDPNRWTVVRTEGSIENSDRSPD